MEIKIHKENPSIQQAMINTKKGAKMVFANNSSTEISVYDKENEDIEKLTLDFVAKKVVDKDEFIKIYVYSLPKLAELKNSTKILFQYILVSVNEEIGKDTIYISFKDYQGKADKNPIYPKISQPTFSRCLNELLQLGIVYKSELANMYFINISYVFNGDRLRFITEYQLKKQEIDWYDFNRT